MDEFSEFIKSVRLSYDKENPVRKVADAISQATTLQKIMYINNERDRLQAECKLLILTQQFYPNIDVSGDLRLRQDLLNQCEQALNQLGNDVMNDETLVTAADIERKRLEDERRKLNRF